MYRTCLDESWPLKWLARCPHGHFVSFTKKNHLKTYDGSVTSGCLTRQAPCMMFGLATQGGRTGSTFNDFCYSALGCTFTGII